MDEPTAEEVEAQRLGEIAMKCLAGMGDEVDHDARDRLDRLAAACLPMIYADFSHEPPEALAARALLLALALRDAVDAALDNARPSANPAAFPRLLEAVRAAQAVYEILDTSASLFGTPDGERILATGRLTCYLALEAVDAALAKPEG